MIHADGPVSSKDLVNEVHEKTGLTAKSAKTAIDAYNSTLAEVLGSGRSVTIVGFGTYKVSKRAARTGRNLKTGEIIEIPEGYHVTFKAGKKLKDTLNNH